jgi:hypothetical protein
VAELYEFEWPVDSAGYELTYLDPSWPSDEPREQIRRRGGPLHFYRPMTQHPGLWRTFAETCQSSDGVLAFTTQFGLHDYDGIRPLHLASLEELSFMHSDIRAVIEDARAMTKIVAELDRGQPSKATKFFPISPNVTAHVIWDRETNRFRFKLTPASLRDALFLQAAEAITGNRKFQRCKNCSTWVLIGPGGHSSRWQFCTDACKMAWHRQQKKIAAKNVTPHRKILT